MLFLRLAWILGFISTRDYDLRVRTKRFGANAVGANEPAARKLEQLLLEERVAVVLILFALVIITYTFLNAPGTA